MLKGKTILLGVTGGIAAYKAAALTSALVKLHANVEVVMTDHATKFVAPLTFEQLSGNKVMVDTFDRNFVHQVEHIALAERTDLVMIQVEGMGITVTNVSGMDLTDLDIICHGLLNGSAFGGRAYTYRITSLAPGASATVYAMDCILGMTQVTRVEPGE